MICTDRQYYIEKALVGKLDLMITRYKHNRDSLIICDGGEGDGKTTATIGYAYYLAQQLGKPFTVDNVFFDVEKMMKFAATTEGQVIVWDEAATTGMAVNWQNRIQQKLIQIMMMARKKKHIYFFVIPKFWKLNEYLVDRAIGLIHVYSPDLIKQGYFVYFKKEAKDYLYLQMKERKHKSYRVGYAFRGTFVKKGFVIDEKEYDRKKDEAIMAIFKDKKENKINIKAIKKNIMLKEFIKEKAKREGRTEKSICEEKGIAYHYYTNWATSIENNPYKHVNIE